MKRREAWSVHVASGVVAATGLVYAWARYAAEPADPFSPHHPLVPLAQHAHVLAAPLLVFAAGLVWREHIWKHYRTGVRRSRRTGLSLLLTLVPMVASGYLIQTTVTPGWRTAWIAVHLVTSALWLLSWLGHAAAVVRSAARRRPRADEGALQPTP